MIYFRVIFAVCFLVMGFAQYSFGIAAWARKYGADCSMCHWGGFKLNKTGQDFLRYGHQMPGETAAGKSLNEYASMTGKVRFNAEQAKAASPSFEEHAFSLYTGGPLDNGFSYFVEMYFHENSGKTSGASDFNDYGRSKLAEAYIQYTRGGDDMFTTVRFGQILSQLLYIHGTGGRVPYARSAALTSKVGSNPYTPFQRNYGIEVDQKFKSFQLGAGLVNGTGSSTLAWCSLSFNCSANQARAGGSQWVSTMERGEHFTA